MKNREGICPIGFGPSRPSSLRSWLAGLSDSRSSKPSPTSLDWPLRDGAGGRYGSKARNGPSTLSRIIWEPRLASLLLGL